MPRMMPSINWFELEILLSLSKKPKYGQQLLNELSNALFEQVSSGRLYPILQKLEKNAIIRKNEEDRGRFYYHITEKGKEELSGATRWALHSLMTTLTRKLSEKISDRVSVLLADEIEQRKKAGNELNAIAVFRFSCKPKEQPLLAPFAERYKEITFYCMHHHITLCGETFPRASQKIYEDFPNIVEMASEFDDVPLKDRFVDAALMIITFHETSDREDYLKEVVRILKPGGIVFLIEFARFDSYILESLFNILHSGGEVDIPMIPYGGMDEKEIKKLMTPHLQDVRVERIKEVLIATGRKG